MEILDKQQAEIAVARGIAPFFAREPRHSFCVSVATVPWNGSSDKLPDLPADPFFLSFHGIHISDEKLPIMTIISRIHINWKQKYIIRLACRGLGIKSQANEISPEMLASRLTPLMLYILLNLVGCPVVELGASFSSPPTRSDLLLLYYQNPDFHMLLTIANIVARMDDEECEQLNDFISSINNHSNFSIKAYETTCEILIHEFEDGKLDMDIFSDWLGQSKCFKYKNYVGEYCERHNMALDEGKKAEKEEVAQKALERGMEEGFVYLNNVKLVICGPPCVGKTAFKALLLNNPAPLKHNSTSITARPVKAIERIAAGKKVWVKISEEDLLHILSDTIRSIDEVTHRDNSPHPQTSSNPGPEHVALTQPLPNPQTEPPSPVSEPASIDHSSRPQSDPPGGHQLAVPASSLTSFEQTRDVDYASIPASVDPLPIPASLDLSLIPASMDPSPTSASLDSSLIPASMDPSPIPASLDSTLISASLDPSPIPDSMDPSLIPASMNPSPIPDSMDPSLIPASMDPSLIPASMDPSLIPASMDPSPISASLDLSLIPDSMDPSLIPASMDPSLISASLDSSLIPVSVDPSSIRASVIDPSPIPENILQPTSAPFDVAAPQGIDYVSKKIIEHLSSPKGRDRSQKLHEAMWIHLLDSGGQPQFTDLLHMFVRGNSLYIILMKVTESLHEKPTFIYSIDGEPLNAPKEMTMTNLQIIERFVHSVAAISRDTLGDKSQPAIAIVATHCDQSRLGRWLGWKETIKKKNKKLLSCLSEFLDLFIFYNRDSNELIFPVDNLCRWSRKKISAEIRHRLLSFQSDISFGVKIPVRWYVFDLNIKEEALKESHGMISLESCYAIGSKLGMDNKEVDRCLIYLDSMRLCIYYSNLLPHVVFTNPQFLVESLSNIVRVSFVKDLHLILPKGVSLSDDVVQFLKRDGIFDTSLLNSLGLKFFPNLFSESDLLLLLQHFRVISIIKAASEIPQYFIPILLPAEHLPEDQKLKFRQKIDPLFVTFGSNIVLHVSQ